VDVLEKIDHLDTLLCEVRGVDLKMHYMRLVIFMPFDLLGHPVNVERST
jgi:hypothetical protein